MFINATNSGWSAENTTNRRIARRNCFQWLCQGRIENPLHDAQERAEAEIDRGRQRSSLPPKR